MNATSSAPRAHRAPVTRIGLAAAAALVLALVPAARADATTVPASQDTFLRVSRPNVNEGANEILAVQRTGSNRALVGFDLTGITPASVTSARLVLSIARNARGWGSAGRTIDAHPLLASFDEGTGKTYRVRGGRTRGTGAGATWACASDSSIANSSTDCAPTWDGGTFGPASASATITNDTAGEVTFDVTADVVGGTSAWLVRKSDERATGRIFFSSREAATAAGNPALAPRLEIVAVTCTPSPEVCNGLDDDCNGQIDDDIAPVPTTCGLAGSACASTGQLRCVNGNLLDSCLAPSEMCNGLDDDCDGQIDELNPGGFKQCETGFAGSCASGVTNCVNGSVVCEPLLEPGTILESCNGFDEDCDGQTDEGILGVGESCAVPGKLGVCASGVVVCPASAPYQVTCEGPLPQAEICDNGIDEDCDGVIDNPSTCRTPD